MLFWSKNPFGFSLRLLTIKRTALTASDCQWLRATATLSATEPREEYSQKSTGNYGESSTTLVYYSIIISFICRCVPHSAIDAIDIWISEGLTIDNRLVLYQFKCLCQMQIRSNWIALSLQALTVTPGHRSANDSQMIEMRDQQVMPLHWLRHTHRHHLAYVKTVGPNKFNYFWYDFNSIQFLHKAFV